MKLKIALAQVNTMPGRLAANAERIIAFIGKARTAKADLVVFPELALPGYLCMDLAFNQQFLDSQERALEAIAESTKGIAAIVGFIRQEREKRPGGRPSLFNSAAFLRDGAVIGVQDKILLPDYDIFDENRYFLSGSSQKVFETAGVRVGIGICEDLWSKGYSRDPIAELKRLGSDVIVTISASPYETGKLERRYQLVCETSARLQVPLVYTNLVGAFDGFDGEVVFDGRSMAVTPSGEMLTAGKSFEEDLLLFDPFRGQPVARPEYDQIAEINDALVLGIRSYFRRHGFSRAFVGVSGGIDSAVVAAIAVSAIGKENVTAVTMPSRHSSDATRKDALKLAKNLGIRLENIAIEKPYATVMEVLRESPEFKKMPEDVTEENIQPRIRMTVLYALANKFGGIVLNTGNKTELALGYCTIYGDMAGGLGVIADLNKERVYELAEYVNKVSGKEIIARSIIERPPTAELKAGQLDEQGMGAPPQVLSPLVDAIVDGMTFGEALRVFSDRFDADLIERTWKTIHANEWKRRQASPGIRISSRTWGLGRRIPMAHDFIG